MHKVRVVQKVRLPAAAERLEAIQNAGYNTFLLRTRDLFLDMLTDSGTNAMTDNQQAAMMQADDAYAGSESFYRLQDAVRTSSVTNMCCPPTRDAPPNTCSPRPSSSPARWSR